MESITLENIMYTYGKHTVLRDVTLSLPIGEMVTICDPSGCGKTTLPSIIGLLGRPSRGGVQHNEMGVYANSSRAVKKLRYTVDFLFQDYGLLDSDTALRNMMSATEYVRAGKEEKKKCIAQVLEKVGLYGIKQQKICQLFGGEQQCAALAKLMAKPCELIPADEPARDLDEENRDTVFSTLRGLNQKGKAVVMVMYNPVLAKRYDEVILLGRHMQKAGGSDLGGRNMPPVFVHFIVMVRGDACRV